MRTSHPTVAAVFLMGALASFGLAFPTNHRHVGVQRFVIFRRSDGRSAEFVDGCTLYGECSSDEAIHNNRNLLHKRPSSIPVHTCRRKFIQFATTVGTSIAGSTASYGSDFNPATGRDNNSAYTSQNKIAVPVGPLAPFSSTRTYRSIVLSNGLQVVLVKDSQAQRASVAMSIDGAGQFSDPREIPGLAHLMEHIVLSSSSGRRPKVMERKARQIWRSGADNNRRVDATKYAESSISDEETDFEDWLAENDGDSNAFTAPGFVCFHFNSPHENLPEGLERFARLFTLEAIENTVEKPNVILREIGRVDAELDRTSDMSRAFYFLKSRFTNPEHPFSRFTAGSRETLQMKPGEEGLDVASYLLRFFRDHYIASKATLVVVGKDEVRALDRWISPFSNVMSQKVGFKDCVEKPYFPPPVANNEDSANGLTQSIILRSKDDVQISEDIQTLCIEWPLSLIYSNCGTRQAPIQHIITAPAVGFILSQIISRRGPGSLRSFLEKFNWVPKDSLTKGVPRITFPVDVSGFQILRLELGVTLDGFASRSAVIAALFESVRTAISKPFQLDLIKQYMSTAILHGYLFAPRPPDAVALAVDSLRFGVGGNGGIGVHGNWYLMPSPQDEVAVENVKRVVESTLRIMADEENAIISIRASPKAIYEFSGGIVDQKITSAPLFSPWQKEQITGARYLVESRTNGGSSLFKSFLFLSSRFDGDELSPPYTNPLMPTKFRSPRPVIERIGAWGRRYFYLDEASAVDLKTRSNDDGWRLTNKDTWREYQPSKSLNMNSRDYGTNWSLWQIPPGYKDFVLLPNLPIRPPEPSIECVFVIQLLSSLPSSFTPTQLSLSNMWLLSFDDAILDLAELGATAGIAYESSFNKAGLRLSFRGVSQSLPSYVRRFCRRLVQHHVKLLDGSARVSDAVYKRAAFGDSQSLKPNRMGTNRVANQVSERDVANQGLLVLKCTHCKSME